MLGYKASKGVRDDSHLPEGLFVSQRDHGIDTHGQEPLIEVLCVSETHPSCKFVEHNRKCYSYLRRQTQAFRSRTWPIRMPKIG